MRHFAQEAFCNEITWDTSYKKLSILELNETFPTGSSLYRDYMRHFLWEAVFNEITRDISYENLSVIRLQDSFPMGSCLLWDYMRHYLWEAVCNEITGDIIYGNLSVIRIHETSPTGSYKKLSVIRLYLTFSVKSCLKSNHFVLSIPQKKSATNQRFNCVSFIWMSILCNIVLWKLSLKMEYICSIQCYCTFQACIKETRRKLNIIRNCLKKPSSMQKMVRILIFLLLEFKNYSLLFSQKVGIKLGLDLLEFGIVVLFQQWQNLFNPNR